MRPLPLGLHIWRQIYIYIISYNTSPRLIECAFIFFSIWVTIGCGFLGRVHVVLGILGHGMKTWLGFSVFCQRTLVWYCWRSGSHLIISTTLSLGLRHGGEGLGTRVDEPWMRYTSHTHTHVQSFPGSSDHLTYFCRESIMLIHFAQ